jgi:O-antigen/teichoic acid export membrane protein
MSISKSLNLIKSILGFGAGHKRTNKTKKNIFVSLLIKGANILSGLLIVPLTLHFINQEKYGIWITLSSIIGWFGFFDIGLGHGLRNKFAEAVANKNVNLARTYVSTTYAIISIFSVLIAFIFFILNSFLNWNIILNVSEDNSLFNQELRTIVVIVFLTFCFSFVLRLITIILTANQEPAKASVFDLLGSVLNLIIVFILTKSTEGSLLSLVLALNISSIVVLFASSMYYFNTSYKQFSPSYQFIDFGKINSLFGLGVKFFILQIAVILLYQTNNIIISQLFGPSEVTPYSISFRYFNYLTMIFSILLTPIWSAFTDAWIKDDIVWVKNVVKKLKLTWVAFLILGIVMLIFSVPFFKIWIGNEISIPFELSALILLYVLLNLWGNIFSTFMNGVSHVKLQMYFGIGAAILNLPLAVFLGKMFGIQGIIIANIVVVLPSVFVYPVYVGRVIKRKEYIIFCNQKHI